MRQHPLLRGSVLLLSVGVLGSAGCGGGTTPGNLDGGVVAVDLGPRSTFTEDEAAAARLACKFKAGDPPGVSLAATAPLGPQIPIDTVVIVMMENRSFDHLLGDLPAAGQPDALVAPKTASNLSSTGQVVTRYHETELCYEDTNHTWAGSHQQWNDGKNDGFVISSEGFQGGPSDGRRAMGYYTAAELPYLYALATTFTVADHFHCSILTETFPNRKYLYAGTSFGDIFGLLDGKRRHTVFDDLNDGNVSWTSYSENPARRSIGIFAETYTRNLDHFPRAFDSFYIDAASGALAQVNFVDPALDSGVAADDFHPPADVQKGDEFLEKVMTALMASPQWPRMAIFLMFDEHGGLYDHVPPPPACPPDGIDPILGPNDPPGKFDRYGFRVPMILVSPYARPHTVSHAVYDQTSMLRFLEARFLFPALTARDANADPFFGMFDFSKAALLTPPSLPHAKVDTAAYDACVAKFGTASHPDLGNKSDGGTTTDGGMKD